MHQVIEMTDKEKFELYMTLPKENLANLLIEANKMLSNLVKPSLVMDTNNIPTCHHNYTPKDEWRQTCENCGMLKP
jgi:hypothetical protein